jgi:hypothetical protein
LESSNLRRRRYQQTATATETAKTTTNAVRTTIVAIIPLAPEPSDSAGVFVSSLRVAVISVLDVRVISLVVVGVIDRLNVAAKVSVAVRDLGAVALSGTESVAK